jgi:predicted nuclease with TOPRIM domain
MKNVDVPLWDKGDDTDDFSKGGASSASPLKRRPSVKKSPLVTKIYKLVLGRKPSSREMAYYKYSSAEEEDILKKLLEGDEHKEILEKAGKYSELKEKNKKLKSTVLRLKSKAKDRANEYGELKRLLEEKNETISSLREEKIVPYLSDEKILEENNVHYSISHEAKRREEKDETFWDRISYLLFGKK